MGDKVIINFSLQSQQQPRLFAVFCLVIKKIWSIIGIKFRSIFMEVCNGIYSGQSIGKYI